MSCSSPQTTSSYPVLSVQKTERNKTIHNINHYRTIITYTNYIEIWNTPSCIYTYTYTYTYTYMKLKLRNMYMYCRWTLTRNAFITQTIELWNRWIYKTVMLLQQYRTCVHCIHMYHLFCNALVHVIYSVVSGQYSYTIDLVHINSIKTKQNYYFFLGGGKLQKQLCSLYNKLCESVNESFLETNQYWEMRVTYLDKCIRVNKTM